MERASNADEAKPKKALRTKCSLRRRNQPTPFSFFNFCVIMDATVWE